MTPETKEAITESEPKRMKGKIIHISEKGFGFITTPEIEFTRVFFHWTGLEQNTLNFKELKKGMKIEFTPKEYSEYTDENGVKHEGRGWRAIRIKVIE